MEQIIDALAWEMPMEELVQVGDYFREIHNPELDMAHPESYSESDILYT